MFKKTFTAAAAMVLVLGLFCGAAFAKAEIKLSNQFPPSHHVSKGLIVFAEKVAACGIESYCIALHAHIADVHDSITRRKGSFEETAEGMRNLLDLDQNLIGKFVISKYNLPYLTETAKLFVELGMKHVSITFPHGC